MKNTLPILFLLFTSLFNAQEICATSIVNKRLEEKNPEIKRRRLEANKNLQNIDVQNYLNTIGATSKNGTYTGEIYEIPVVIHVIESSSRQSVTDAQIINWIENTNQIYATTYGNGYYPEGTGVNGGTVIPFKFVLAKKDQNCNATSGILRYNGDSVPGYTSGGVKAATNTGADEDDVVNLAPHWREDSYYNIYIITGFDASFQYGGVLGYAYFPQVPDNKYHTFMEMPVVTHPNDATLAHEFGHSMGLHHPFNGASSNGGECPANDNCMTQNDFVCDTSPTQSLLGTSPIPTNNQLNTCTGQNYDGVQYNVMNYTSSPRKFTPGQRERAIALFMQNRSSLTTSLVGSDSDESTTVTASTCQVTGVTSFVGANAGPTKVTLGSLSNQSGTYSLSNPEFYIDYTQRACINKTLSAEIPKNQESVLTVKINSANQYIKAWIDFNDNGTFESNEKIADKANAGSGTHTFSFTPPSTATTETNLRMRVSADNSSSLSACGQYNAGQAEDYIVRILNSLATDETSDISENCQVLFERASGQIKLLNSDQGFGDYQIFDFSGKLIQKGNSKSKTILFNNNVRGGYILQFTNKDKMVSFKFVK